MTDTAERLAPAPARRVSSGSRRPRADRSWIGTVVGIALLAVMLFPVYWMVNISLQPAGPAIQAAWFPFEAQFNGYATALSEQGQALGTAS